MTEHESKVLVKYSIDTIFDCIEDNNVMLPELEKYCVDMYDLPLKMLSDFKNVMSNIVNYAGHKKSWWGSYRRFALTDKSVNNWIWAIPTWGEAWHNNHHRFPKNYTTSQKWYEIDISGLIIKLIKWENKSLDNNKSLV